MQAQTNIRAAVVLGLVVIGPPAFAQQGAVCADRNVVVDRLEQEFGEMPTGGGLVSGSQLLEIWSAPDTGTWTALMTRADGISCILGSGENWNQKLPDAIAAGTQS